MYQVARGILCLLCSYHVSGLICCVHIMLVVWFVVFIPCQWTDLLCPYRVGGLVCCVHTMLVEWFTVSIPCERTGLLCPYHVSRLACFLFHHSLPSIHFYWCQEYPAAWLLKVHALVGGRKLALWGIYPWGSFASGGVALWPWRINLNFSLLVWKCFLDFMQFVFIYLYENVL